MKVSIYADGSVSLSSRDLTFREASKLAEFLTFGSEKARPNPDGLKSYRVWELKEDGTWSELHA